MGDGKAIEPHLARDNKVILGFSDQGGLPCRTSDGIDLAGGYFDGAGIAMEKTAIEVHPHGLGLIHGQEDAPVPGPGGRELVPVVVDVLQGKPSQTRRQWIAAIVVRDAQSALEIH